MLNKSTCTKLTLILCLVVINSPVYAQQTMQWALGLGLGNISLPYYRGASNRMDLTTLFPYVRFRSESLTVDEDGFRGKVFAHDRLRLDLSLAAGIPVPSNKNPLREGMPKLDTSFEIGPELEYIISRNPAKRLNTRLAIPVRAAFSIDSRSINSIGWITSPYFEIHKTTIQPQGWRLSMAFGPMYADRRYHDYYYGVASNYVTASRPFYQAVSGNNGKRITLTITKRFQNYWLGAFVRHDWLDSAVFRDSPLVDSNHYHAAGLAIAIILGQSLETKPDLSVTEK